MIPHGNKSRPKWHMAVDDIITMVNKMKNKPRLIVLQHFGFWMIDEGINKQAKIVEQSTKVRTIAAKDFMEIDLDTLKTRVLKE
jgi:transcription elongation factor